jgi:alpha-L-fucosidase 2
VISLRAFFVGWVGGWSLSNIHREYAPPFSGVCFAFVSGAGLSSRAGSNDLTLWYSQPAQKWTEALPIGNGHMGAMVFGGTASERIQFNEDTLWRGKPHDYVRDGALEVLPEIRRLVFEGKADEAGKLAKEKAISDPVRQLPYQPFGDLRLTFPGHENVTEYRRELDLGYRHGHM